MKKLIPLLLLGMILISGCVEETPNGFEPDSKCNWESGFCDMEIGSGYYYNSETNECNFFEGGSGCNEPPFKTLKECESMCSKKESIIKDKSLPEEYNIAQTYILSKNKENKVYVDANLVLNNLKEYPEADQIVISIGENIFEIIEYEEIDKNEDNTFSVTITAPKIPGRYRLDLVEYPNREVTRTIFDLIVFGETKTQDEAFQVANNGISSKISGSLVNITGKKINLLNNKWHVDFTIDYSFGCCGGCSPGEMCIAVCVPCGIKTAEGHYVINYWGVIEEENIEEIACKGSGAWFRDITGNELCSINWDNLN